MAYTDFTLSLLKKQFGLINQKQRLFSDLPPIPVSDTLARAFERAGKLSLRTEKAKSEWMVVPVINEILDREGNFFTVYSGESLNADPANGLNGECDFILSKETGSLDVSFPIVQIVEAKKHDTDIGIPQCAAQLVGARILNLQQGIVLDKLYGCVTTGRDWIFICLEDNTLLVDSRTYFFSEIPEILAVFQHILDYYKRVLV
jgi:hypothetical protein